ncbi:MULTISPECIES: ABC transporter ATP-binding protein [unclassified Sedimentibacter]|uniref:ABC transporter ATP-binding protein n=1 Tax=unclassified Sedimentibacter TaxID=2649220 RepID=UPI0027DEC0D5|nr:ATP-binding cassette domain-containing protein [Sedimentibacter sp. MB35-C1]WMJ77575.1 ATP-binding cassette domain-containing protein [Sedimentibacter sp. MB35-C1]
MLKITNVNKVFNKNTHDEHKALDNLNLEVCEGEFVTIIGGNGAGKSTMFNIISGSLLCDSGNVILGGENITYMPEHKRASFIGRIFQDPMKGTAPNMTVGENLVVAYMRSSMKGLLKMPSRKEKEYIKEHLADLNLGLEDRIDTKIGLLSGGQRQAVTLVMATLVKPRLLLLDEHTAALDPLSAETVLELTNRIVSENNITTLMITHNISSALKLGTRTIMMDSGAVAICINGEERKGLSVPDVIQEFSRIKNKEFDDDNMLL